MRTDPSLIEDGKRIAKKWEPVARAAALYMNRLDDVYGGRSISDLGHLYEFQRETFSEYHVEADAERKIALAVFDLYAMPGGKTSDLDHALSEAIDRYAEIDDDEHEARLSDQRAVMRAG